MSFNEADTKAKLIDPAIHKRGWSEDLLRREESAGTIEIINNKSRRNTYKRVDYVLRFKVNSHAQPVALALIEAKKETSPPAHGLEQAKGYAKCHRLNVKFVFSSNGHQFVGFDFFTGLTSAPKPMDEFPTPEELCARYEEGMGFSLESPVASPLLQPYPGGEGARRYYQDAAIRAVMEEVARCEADNEPKRALLSMATGCGKTFIAVNLLKRISDAGQLTRALFLCDRDELRTQALKAFQGVFGSDAVAAHRNADGSNNAQNARIHITTYQTLGVENEEDNNFLTEHYPPNYFSHIVIDECHRSAWGKWSQVLTRNDEAVQIGLTATPRQLDSEEKTEEVIQDSEITANNISYFGEPVYEYEIGQAIEDGYLAACEIRKGRVNIDETGLTVNDILEMQPIDYTTGKPMLREKIEAYYSSDEYENRILLPDRIQAMCEDLFRYLIETGGPEQKTIIFCVRDLHADEVATHMNNLYAKWCADNKKPFADYYAFKCTAASSGNDQLPDFRGASRSHFIATTVDLLTTGVDVPCVRNIVFFRYLKSPISFYQMIGRGTRIDVPTNKLMFRIYDYTNATRLFGEDFVSAQSHPGNGGGNKERPDDPDPPTLISVKGFDVKVTDAGHFIVIHEGGEAVPIPIDEYKERLATRLTQKVATLDNFRHCWVNPEQRHELINTLVTGGYSPTVIRAVDEKENYDLYDVLAELGWGMNPRTRPDRAFAFRYKHEDWIDELPEEAGATILAIADQFQSDGTDGLESRQLFQTPAVRTAGGLEALRLAGEPVDLLMETKSRMFSA